MTIAAVEIANRDKRVDSILSRFPDPNQQAGREGNTQFASVFDRAQPF